MLAPFSLQSFPIGDTRYCLNQRLAVLGILGVIFAGVYDTLVFLAITWSLLRSHFYTGPKSLMKIFLTGEGMGSISRAMLQTGQIYYL